MEERTARLTILIDPRKKKLFERLCAEEDATPSQVVRRLLRRYIEERTGKPWAPDDVKEVDACATDDFSFDDCEGDGDHRVAAVLNPASFEAGVDEFGRDFSEELVVQHYATEGIFEYEVRIADQPETRWVARQAASGQELRLWFVARDDRGGVSVAERRVRVR